MPQLKINIDEKTYAKFKELAKADERSTTQYISRSLRFLAGTLQQPDGLPIPALQQQSNQHQPLTLEQLQAAGVQNIKLQTQTNLTPEEEEMQRLKLERQKNKALEEREEKWYKRCKEAFSKYSWYRGDEYAKYFAHIHVYGNEIYQKYGPDDAGAVWPEPDDTRMEKIIQAEIDEWEDELNREETDPEEAYREAERKEREEQEELNKQIIKLYDNPDSKDPYYLKIRTFCMNNEYYEEYANLLSNQDVNYLKEGEDGMLKSVIYSALGIPSDHKLSDSEWQEIADIIKNNMKSD